MTFSTFASPGVGLQGGGGSGSGGTPGGTTTQIQYNNAGAFAGASGLTTNGTNLTFGSASQLLWSTDLILARRAAANLRLGAADTTGTTAPTAQTLSVQSWTSSTNNNQPGANFTIAGSQGTGTGAGGSIVFQVAPAGSSGTAQNALVTFLEATSARAFNLYNTTDVATNYERGKIAWSSNVLQIGTEKAGTGTARALEFQTDGVSRVNVATNGTARFYFNVQVDESITIGNTKSVLWSNRLGLYSPADGVMRLSNWAFDGFDRLQFGGTTSSFPALKRSSTTLQARLADDSGFASVQGKLTTDTAYTAGDPTTTGYLVVYDSAGVAYKIPAVAV